MKNGKMSLLLMLCLLVLTGSAFAQTDLSVTDVSLKEKGNGVEIAATIKNESTQDANSYSVQFFVDNQLIDTKNAGKLKKNKTKKITANWDTSNLSSGDYSIKVEVVNVSPSDDNVSNNTYNTNYQIEGNSPDLKIEEVSFKTKGNNESLVEVTAEVKNIGSGDASNFKVNFYADGQLIKSFDQGQLKADRSSKITAEWDTSNKPGGEYAIKVEITNVTPEEEDTANNSYNTSYAVEDKKPDLTITNLSFKTKGNNENEIEVTADIKNTGTEDAQSYTIKLFADDNLFSTENEGQIKKNQTKKITTTWDVSDLGGGNYTIKAEIVDVSPEEENTNNNSYSAEYSIESKKPDLTVINITFKTKGNNYDEVEVTAEIKNIGNWDGESFIVGFYANDVLFDSGDFGKIKKNQTKKVGADWEISDLEPGEYEITAQISDVKPTESDVSNNSFTTTYTVESHAPDLVLSEISFKEHGQGGSVSVDFSAQNIGEGDAESYLVSLYYLALNSNAISDSGQARDSSAVEPDSVIDIVSADTMLIETYEGKKLKAGKDKKIQINWNYLGLPSGEYKIIAEANNVVPDESDTTNNLVTTNFMIPCPDLYVYDVKFAPGEGIAKIDHHTTIHVKIKNSGPIKANSCKVGVYYDLTPADSSDDPNLSEPIGGELIEVSGIKPNDHSVTPLHVQWEPLNLLPDVVYPVYVIITDGDPEECDTTNNMYVTSYFFQESSNDSTENKFSLISPGLNAVLPDTFVTFLWEALICDSSKKDTMDVFYNLYIDTDSLFSNPVIVENLSETFYTYGPLADQTTYYWKVVATNCRGKWLWSNEVNWNFTIDFSYGFSLFTPIKDDNVETILPTFTWEALANEDTGVVVYYNLYLDIDSSFTNPLIVDSLTLNEHTLVDSLSDNSIYFWKVKAYNNAGAEIWSREQDWFFSVLTNTNNNPGTFSLLTPAFEDTVLTLLPEFFWEQSFDADTSDSVSYLLYLSTDNGFSSAVVSDTLSDTTYVPTVELNDSTKYYWKVKAVDKNGGETWSTQTDWYFYTLETSFAKLETPDIQTKAGEVFVVPILLDNITNGELPVYSFQIQLQFDPTKLIFMDALYTERTGELPIMVSFTPQTISFVLFNNPGVFLAPGTGAIINLQFFAADPENIIDTTGVNFLITRLLDNETNEIPLEISSGLITIQKQLLIGDLNNDGKLTITDIETLLNIIMGLIQPNNYQQAVGDINSDGQVDLLDLQQLIKLVNPPMVALQKVLDEYEIQDYPTNYELTQNYPNPFNSTTMIRFSIPEVTHVNVSIFNINGQLVKTLMNGNMPMGFHNVLWDGTTTNGNLVTSGSYYYVMKTDKYTSIKSITLIK